MRRDRFDNLVFGQDWTSVVNTVLSKTPTTFTVPTGSVLLIKGLFYSGNTNTNWRLLAGSSILFNIGSMSSSGSLFMTDRDRQVRTGIIAGEFLIGHAQGVNTNNYTTFNGANPTFQVVDVPYLWAVDQGQVLSVEDSTGAALTVRIWGYLLARNTVNAG